MADTEYTREVRLTLDEIAFVMNELRGGFHDGTDFEPECPSCTAFQKLATASESAALPSASLGEQHADHPMRHWDRTCLACNPGGAPTPPTSLNQRGWQVKDGVQRTSNDQQEQSRGGEGCQEGRGE